MYHETIPKYSTILIIVTTTLILLSNTASTASGKNPPRAAATEPPRPAVVSDPRRTVGLRSSRFKETLNRDIIRYKGIHHRAKKVKLLPSTRSASRGLTEEEEDIPLEMREAPLKSTIEGSVKMPMYAAAEYEMGEYVVDMEIGKPGTKLRLVIDTGSDLTWVKCKKGNKGCVKEEHVLDADKSKSYKAINCDTALCKEDFLSLSSLDVCPNPTAPCLYNYSYGDAGLSTYGIFGREMATLPTTTGKPVTLPGLLIGCTESYTDKARLKHADGVLGLGIHPYSFALQAVNRFGGSYSYCLVDHLSPANITNYLIFGDYKEKAPTHEFMRYTELLISDSAPYYWLSIKGISLDRQMLDVDPTVWDRNTDGGTILDSGTAATYWAESAYRAIMDDLIPALEKDHPRLPAHQLGDGKLDFEYCFNSTATPLNPKLVPRLEIHFSDGARFKPLVKSYIVDDGPDVSCIGFLEAPAGLNIIGNIMQQNYLWEFDLHQNTVGYVASTCG